MRGKEVIFGISLLLFAGCQATAPMIQQSDDPFPMLGTAVAVPQLSVIEEESGGLTPRRSVKTKPEENESEEEEFTFEIEESSPLSEAEQEEILSQNQWVKNVALISMLESGRKTNAATFSPEERQRLDEINRLNMDKNQLAKLENQRFEYIDGSASDWRWMHRGVDKLHAMPQSQRVRPDVFLREKKYKEKKYATLRANAGILMGRDGNTSPTIRKFLLQIVQSEATDYKIRCAAVEVLGRMETTRADDLIPLVEHAKITEVWEELLVAIAESLDPWEHECFLEPFYSPVSDIRLAAARIWRRKSLEKHEEGSTDVLIKRKLPEKFLEIAKQEGNPAVRVEIIKTLGVWNVPDLFPLLKNDMRHRTADVRNAAMIALADTQCEEAIPIIKDQLRDSLGANRAAALAALRKLGALDEVFKLVNDKDPVVRIEVAKTFSERCTSQTAAFAKSYISDRNTKVQSATLEAVGGWSVEEAGTLFLDAAKSPFQDVRCLATDMLAQRGITYSGFDPTAKPETQKAQHQELVEVFREAVGIDPMLESNSKEHNASFTQQVSAIVPEDAKLTEVRHCLDDWSDRTMSLEQRQLLQRRLTAHGHQLMPMIDHLLTMEKRNIPESLDRVFVDVEPIFQEIEHLKSDDLSTVRRASAELARLGTIGSLPKLAAKRIVDLAAKQDDPMVLTQLMTALENADPDLVCQLARPLLQSESARVRRVACEMLKQFGTSEDIELLHDSLRDSNREVVRGALSAIDTLLEADDDHVSSVSGTLKIMLTQEDANTQIDVAATLHRLGYTEGTDALRRLAASNDPSVRAYTAKTVSALGDSVFVPILIRFLNDTNGTVRNEALKGLPALTGHDIGGGSTQQQIERWKDWAKK